MTLICTLLIYKYDISEHSMNYRVIWCEKSFVFKKMKILTLSLLRPYLASNSSFDISGKGSNMLTLVTRPSISNSTIFWASAYVKLSRVGTDSKSAVDVGVREWCDPRPFFRPIIIQEITIHSY